MPRPQRCRKVCQEPEYVGFSPEGISCGENVLLTVDEYEVVRLVDLQQLTHSQAAKQMEISRTTVTEIYNSARMKIADCIVNGKRLIVSGGNYKICSGDTPVCEGHCFRPMTNNIAAAEKGSDIMRIAVTYENGQIFQHFGHTEQFKIYDVQDGKITSEELVPTLGSGHGALAGFLKMNSVDALICGGIGGGAQTALAQAGIRLYGGVNGSADDAVNALINGTLGFDPNVKCSHHEHEHGSEGHSCGSHGCESNGCH